MKVSKIFYFEIIQTTVVTEEIWMNFIANKDESEKDNENDTVKDKLTKLKGVIKCRFCKEDHWTTQCPYSKTSQRISGRTHG